MLRRPPISTLTDTLFPYTTLFRSLHSDLLCELPGDQPGPYRKSVGIDDHQTSIDVDGDAAPVDAAEKARIADRRRSSRRRHRALVTRVPEHDPARELIQWRQTPHVDFTQLRSAKRGQTIREGQIGRENV